MSNSLACSHCFRQFSDLDVLQCHISMKHYNYAPYICEQCDSMDQISMFSTEIAIKKHYLEVHNKQTFHYRVSVSPASEEALKQVQDCLAKCMIKASPKVLPNSSKTPCAPENRVEVIDLEEDFLADSPMSPCLSPSATPGSSETSTSKDLVDLSSRSLINLPNQPPLPASIDTPSFRKVNLVKREIKVSPFQNSNYCDQSPGVNVNYGASDKTIDNTNLENALIGSNSSLPAQNIVYKMNENTISAAAKIMTDCLLPRPAVGKRKSAEKAKKEPIAKKTCDISESTACQLRRQPSTTSSVCEAEMLEQVQCARCPKSVSNKESVMVHHINLEHLKYPFYACRLCSEKFCGSKARAIEHVEKVHEQGASMLMENSGKYRSEVLLRLNEFFPVREKKVKKLKLKVRKSALRRIPSDSASSNSYGSNQTSKRLYQERSLNCFDLELQAMFGERKRQLECRECKENVKYTLDYVLLDHVNKKHLKLVLFKCRGCGKEFNDAFDRPIKRHVKKEHNGDKSLIIDYRSNHRQVSQDECIKMFGKS